VCTKLGKMTHVSFWNGTLHIFVLQLQTSYVTKDINAVSKVEYY